MKVNVVMEGAVTTIKFFFSFLLIFFMGFLVRILCGCVLVVVSGLCS
jgi:hypothetical protein